MYSNRDDLKNHEVSVWLWVTNHQTIQGEPHGTTDYTRLGLAAKQLSDSAMDTTGSVGKIDELNDRQSLMGSQVLAQR